MINRFSRRLALAAGVALLATGVAGPAAGAPTPGTPAAVEGQILLAAAPDAIRDSYVVVLKDSVGTATAEATKQTVDQLVDRHGGAVQFTYTAALNGFAVRASEAQARRLAGDSRVAYVAQDQKVSINVFVQPAPPSWGLDRIDERSLPLDNKYHYPNVASGVVAYILDTGIRYTHQEFGGRAVFGFDAFGGNGNDCHGHGTHVAGTVGGSRVGVAKSVRLVSVRVLDCNGSGSWAGVIAGVNWVTINASASPNVRSVANMSLGGLSFPALDTAVTNSIAANVHYSVAAGNSNADACGFSPAATPRATTVGSTDINDNRSVFSNWGTCVDLFAPGQNIYSAWATSDNAYNTISGTSMASPHAAGVAALWRWKFPADNADAVAKALVVNATPGVVVNPGVGSPNLLLFSNMIPM